MSMPLSLMGYRLATLAATPIAGGLLSYRMRLGKEHPGRLAERRGFPGRERPRGPLVWLHGASVGESLSLLPLVEKLTQSGRSALVTTGTVTSAELMERRLPAGAFHQFSPLDAPAYMRRFFAHWRPDLGLVAESELWPNMIVEAGRAGVPLAMINARMSERSYARWLKAPAFIRALLDRFDQSLAQSPGDAERLAGLGARGVQVIGNLKFDAPAPPADRQELAALAGLVSGRPIWIAASTHEGEEFLAAEAHRQVAKRFPGVLTLIAPRHPVRSDAVADELRAAGFRIARRSKGERPAPDTEIYLCDTMGELGLFYRLAGVVFIGKTLIGRGGQNPIEPAKLACAILHGPHVGNFRDVFVSLDAARGALEVTRGEDLGDLLTALFADPARLRAMARSAAEVVETQAGASERALAALAPRLIDRAA